PVVDYRFRGPEEPALTYFSTMDEYRRTATVLRSEEAAGYWMFTSYDSIRDGLQQADLFSSRATEPTDNNPAYKWVPLMLDPPEHGKWRRVLAPYFSPGRVQGLEAGQRKFANDLIDTF